jgi:hypothetical protein
MSNTSHNTDVAVTVLDQLADALPKGDKNRGRYNEQKAEGVVNPIVLAALLGVRPQMIYQYLSKGKFTEDESTISQNSTQKKVIKLDEANTWAAGYTERKVAKEAAKAAKVEAELHPEAVEAETVNA